MPSLDLLFHRGDLALDLLSHLDRQLTELGHLPAGSSEELTDLVARLERRNLIFKVRVLGDRLDERAQPTRNTTPTT